MRQRIFEIIEIGNKNDKASRAYDFFMMAVIVLSLIPLLFKNSSRFLTAIDYFAVIIFMIDYLLRVLTADLKMKRGKLSFVLYPFTIMALIDLISIFPVFIPINQGFKLLKVVRLLRTFRVFRVFKGFRYSRNFRLIVNVFKKQKNSLIAVCAFALGYIFISALVIFNAEPETFDSFFDALYWATISLTTMGYGDIYATSRIGKLITMISALFGIAIVALPAGLISAGFMSEITKQKKEHSGEDDENPAEKDGNQDD